MFLNLHDTKFLCFTSLPTRRHSLETYFEFFYYLARSEKLAALKPNQSPNPWLIFDCGSRNVRPGLRAD